jgi:CTP:molybdopterin cytidylyltransferase MocA
VGDCLDAVDDSGEARLKVVAAVLAAGGGLRFGGTEPKLRATFRGKPLVRWSVDAALAAGFDDVVVVSGAVEVGDLLPEGVVVHRNVRWHEGIATSLGCATTIAGRAGADAVVVGLGDQPLVLADAWRAVAAATTAPIAVATYGGRRRNPVRLAREVWPLLPATGDEGARVLMAERPELVVEIACPGDPVDIDTQEDLDRWS